jgi:hypothetical protein
VSKFALRFAAKKETDRECEATLFWKQISHDSDPQSARPAQ